MLHNNGLYLRKPNFDILLPRVHSIISYFFLLVPAVLGASLTESALKTVPQVVNVMELKDKETPSPGSNLIR